MWADPLIYCINVPFLLFHCLSSHSGFFSVETVVYLNSCRIFMLIILLIFRCLQFLIFFFFAFCRGRGTEFVLWNQLFNNIVISLFIIPVFRQMRCHAFTNDMQIAAIINPQVAPVPLWILWSIGSIIVMKDKILLHDRRPNDIDE